VVTWHNAVLDDGRWRGLQSLLEARVAVAPNVTLGVSPDLVTRVRSLGGTDVRFLPVGAAALPVPARPVEQIRAELRADDRPLVVGIGRLHHQKGFDVLLDAAARWIDRLPRPLLVIAGDGPERSALAQRADRRDVDVRWLGYVSDRVRIAELLAVADVVVVPSRWEGSPLTVHEALGAGRPVVATAVGGLPDLVGPDAASFVPKEDVEALADAVTHLLESPGARASLAAAARRAAANWPDETTTTAAVLEVYAELLSRPG
jgi:glycosyltransferase involved in cell wall biosynthesis